MFPKGLLRAVSAPIAIVVSVSCSEERRGAPRTPGEAIHDRAIVVDAHAHPKPGYEETLNLGEKRGTFELDFITMKEGGLDAVFFSVPLLVSEGRPAGPERVLEDIAAVASELQRLDGLAEAARSADDVRRLHSTGKRAVLFGIEAQDPFGGDLSVLERFHRAGVRMITLPGDLLLATPGEQADSSQIPSDDSSQIPLNDFGLAVVAEMNRLGMIIDITHLYDRQQMDVIGASTQPVVASHSCTRALNDIPRQMPDSIIRALAETGGVVGVTFFPGHISSEFPDRDITLAELVDHIDHIVEIVGVDHVGFGSDFLGSDSPHTVGLESAAGLPNLTFELLERGYTEDDVQKIMGGNLLRVLQDVSGTGG
jgi:membrane dipeptidase